MIGSAGTDSPCSLLTLCVLCCLRLPAPSPRALLKQQRNEEVPYPNTHRVCPSPPHLCSFSRIIPIHFWGKTFLDKTRISHIPTKKTVLQPLSFPLASLSNLSVQPSPRPQFYPPDLILNDSSERPTVQKIWLLEEWCLRIRQRLGTGIEYCQSFPLL